MKRCHRGIAGKTSSPWKMCRRPVSYDNSFQVANPTLDDTRVWANTVQLRSEPNSRAPPVNSVQGYILPNSPSIPWDCVFRWVSCYFCLDGRQNGPPPWMDLFRTSSREPSQMSEMRQGDFLGFFLSKQLQPTRAVWWKRAHHGEGVDDTLNQHHPLVLFKGKQDAK